MQKYALWSVIAAFGTYFCMYAFRRPFTVASYSEQYMNGIEFKTILVTMQAMGYMVSKFVGIKFVSEIQPHRRALAILLLIGFAELSLLLFAVTPAPWNALFLFMNGLPLGMVFGLVVGFIEGRRYTEFIAVGLCSSLIFSDGFMKSLGYYLIAAGLSEYWMPFFAGLMMMPLLLIFLWMLMRIPKPSSIDISERTERSSMTKEVRSQFFRRYAPGIIGLLILFLAITIVRSYRADFTPEIWKDLGYNPNTETFTQSETYIAFIVMLIVGLIALIRDNRKAFFASLSICGLGLAIIVFTLFIKLYGTISPFLFMVTIGVGLYLPYAAFHVSLFERLLAMTKERGTTGYLFLLTDSFGYLGYVAIMLTRNFIADKSSVYAYFFQGTCVLTAISIASVLFSYAYFRRVKPQA
jgi:uncharacterized membrane protein